MSFGVVPEGLQETNSVRRFLRDARNAAGAIVAMARIPMPENDVDSVNCVVISGVGLCRLNVLAKKFCID